MKYLSSLTLLLLALSSQAQSPAAMYTSHIDKLCAALESDFRAGIPTETTDTTVLKLGRVGMFHSDLPIYLHNAYYRSGQPVPSVTTQAVSEGELLRIGEGRLRIEWVEKPVLGAPFYAPAEMDEKVYYYLNGQLVKARILQGHTDYNAIPSNYWINTLVADIFYFNGQEAGISYLWNDSSYDDMGEGWREILLKDKVALPERAFQLLNAYKLRSRLMQED